LIKLWPAGNIQRTFELTIVCEAGVVGRFISTNIDLTVSFLDINIYVHTSDSKFQILWKIKYQNPKFRICTSGLHG
jgi:hypothetical protein